MSIKASSRSAELKRMLSTDPDIIAGDFEDGVPWNESAADVTVWQPDEEVDLDSLDEEFDTSGLIVLMDEPAEDWIANALRAGAKAILPADISAEGLVAVVHAVASGLVVLPGNDRSVRSGSVPVRMRPPVEALTPREQEILSAMSEGLTNKEAAARFQISEHTVKFHVASIMSKLGAASRTEAVTLAIRHGLLMI